MKKNKKISSAKLILSRETLRLLESTKLNEAAGAAVAPATVSGCPGNPYSCDPWLC